MVLFRFCPKGPQVLHDLVNGYTILDNFTFTFVLYFPFTKVLSLEQKLFEGEFLQDKKRRGREGEGVTVPEFYMKLRTAQK